MSKEKKKKNCSSSKKLLWWVFGAASLFSRTLAAFALIAIAFKMHPLKQEARFFNSCVEESLERGNSLSESVGLCNGGN